MTNSYEELEARNLHDRLTITPTNTGRLALTASDGPKEGEDGR